jgi:hypothetical protein
MAKVIFLDKKRYPALAAVLAEAPHEPGFMQIAEETDAARKGSDPSLKPPKKWANKMIKEIKKKNPSYSQEMADETMGDIWYHKLDNSKRKEIREREGKHYGPAHPQASAEEDCDSVHSADEMAGWVA